MRAEAQDAPEVRMWMSLAMYEDMLPGEMAVVELGEKKMLADLRGKTRQDEASLYCCAKPFRKGVLYSSSKKLL